MALRLPLSTLLGAAGPVQVQAKVHRFRACSALGVRVCVGGVKRQECCRLPLSAAEAWDQGGFGYLAVGGRGYMWFAVRGLPYKKAWHWLSGYQ